MAAVLALGLTACHDDTWVPQTEKTGELNLTNMDVDVNQAERLVSRQAESVDVSDFAVEIWKGTEEVEHWQYSQMPEIVKLPVGDYTARVYSHEVQKAEWDKPYYIGSKDFKIENGKITNIGSVECSFASIRVTIIYDEGLLGHMGSDCKVTVVANDEGNLEFATDETRSGYFEAIDGSNTLVATFSGTVDGSITRLTQTFNDVVPGTHYRITYVPRKPEQVGNAGISIAIETEVASANADGTITIEEDVIDNPGQRPGTEEEEQPGEDDPNPDDPQTGDGIEFASDYLNLDGTPNKTGDFGENEPDEGITGKKPAVVNIASSHGIAHLNVKIESDDEEFMGAVGEYLPTEFDLATIKETNPTVATSIQTDLGLPLGPYPSDNDGITRVDFDITKFMGLLAGFEGGEHRFKLTVINNKGDQKELILKFTSK